MNRLRGIVPYKTISTLMYHQIQAITPEEDTFRLVPPEVFDAQMKYLYDHGFTTVTLDDVLTGVDKAEKTHGRRIVITFDDGYFDNYTNAFPILQKYGFSATIFLVTDFLGKRFGRVQTKYLMDWSHVREMSKYGISFQSHTCTHPNLTKLSNEGVLKELLECREKIEDALGIGVRHLAYPGGKYDKRVMQLTEDSGYDSAYAGGKSDKERYCMERFGIALRYGRIRFPLKTSAWASWIRTIRDLMHF